MSLTLPKETGGDFELPPADTHVATCYRVVDKGTQKIEWQGQVKFQHKILISWELDALMQDGKPFSVHKSYTFSSHEKATMRQDLESWRGVPFTPEDMGNFKLANLLGKSCLIGIVHTNKNGKNYANISSIMKLPKGMTPPALVNQLVEFDLGDFKADTYASFSQGLRETIALSPEYQQAIRGKSPTQTTNDDPLPDYDASIGIDEIPF